MPADAHERDVDVAAALGQAEIAEQRRVAEVVDALVAELDDEAGGHAHR